MRVGVRKLAQAMKGKRVGQARQVYRFLCLFPLFIHLFPSSGGLWGEGEKERPARIDHFDLEQDMVIAKPALPPGSGKPLPWPSGLM